MVPKLRDLLPGQSSHVRDENAERTLARRVRLSTEGLNEGCEQAADRHRRFHARRHHRIPGEHVDVERPQGRRFVLPHRVSTGERFPVRLERLLQRFQLRVGPSELPTAALHDSHPGTSDRFDRRRSGI
jgi:hypothetical protein